ncbi:hypothetical protein SLA2020_003190 [Shorea laevis]
MNLARKTRLSTNPACAWVHHKPRRKLGSQSLPKTNLHISRIGFGFFNFVLNCLCRVLCCVCVSTLFQSLLFEACERMVNRVNGAIGLLWMGNWHVCQVAVETVLLGGTLWPLSELMVSPPASDETSEATWTDTQKLQETMNLNSNFRFTNSRSKVSPKRKMEEEIKKPPPFDLDLCLTPTFTAKEVMNRHYIRCYSLLR